MSFAENTAQRSRRLKQEARDKEIDLNRVATTSSFFEAPDGSDNRVYDAETGAVVDDALTEDQSELFHEMLDEIDSGEAIDLGEGSFPNVEAAPLPVTQKARESRPAKPERVVVQRAPDDNTKKKVRVMALDDIDATVGFNGGKSYKMERGKVYLVDIGVAKWLANQNQIGPPPNQNWMG